jgi:Ulp1 family protease
MIVDFISIIGLIDKLLSPQVLVPIQLGNHWTLLAFSTKYLQIMYCDSVSKSETFSDVLLNIDLLASYMFPSILAAEWKTSQVQQHYRFQSSHNDCGFHLLNFARAAVDDVRIETNNLAFAKLKSHLADVHKLKILP